jgi:cyclopropane fatty-acyl-phospholipid synthase-like methyltransferase
MRTVLPVSACPQCYSVAGGRLIEIAMQEVYREPSYYEGGESGYADTSYAAQEFALRAMFQRLLQNLAKRGLTGGDLLEIGCGYGYLLDEASSFFQRRVGREFSPQGAEIARQSGRRGVCRRC